MKDSQLLYFAYADFEEERRNYERVKTVYDRLLKREHVDPTLVRMNGRMSHAVGRTVSEAYILVLHPTDEFHASSRGRQER